MFVQMISDFQGGFCISKFRHDFGISITYEWSLNNYDAIEIKNKGFYASNVTLLYVQNSTSKLKLRRALFSWLVWVVFLAIDEVTALSGDHYKLSITNMMIMQTLKRCIGWITISRMLRMLDDTKIQKKLNFYLSLL